jgi:protein O-mannosyl-transferase
MAAALVLLTFAIYWQTRAHDFADLDDGLYVVDNPNVAGGVSVGNVQWAFTTGRAANWHPVTWISHQIDASLFGLNAGRHHLVNVAWHVLNTLLLFGLLRTLTGAVWRSALVAALFAAHPAHVESVAWISERKDVLSTFFWLATTWAWVRWVRAPAPGRYVAVVALFALGLMSKPMLITLPFTLLLLDRWPLARRSAGWPRRLREKAPLFVMAALSTVVTIVVQRSGGAVATLDVLPLGDRIANATLSYGRYLRHLVWPVDLAVFYPYVPDLPAGPVAVAALAIVALTALSWRLRQARPYLLVGWLWFLGTMVPVIGVLQIGMQAMADRYTYVPYIGLFVAVAWGAADAAARAGVPANALRALGLLVVLAAATTAHAQTATWRTSETLWLRAVTVTRNNATAHNSLGAVYGNQGRVPEAIAQFEAALRANPDPTDLRKILPNLGRALISANRIAEAIPHLERARALVADRADLRHQLALAYAVTGRTPDAIEMWAEALRIDPAFEDAYYTMGVALASERRIEEARRAFETLLRLNPAREDARQALAGLGGR